MLHLCVINLREIALSPTVLDSNTLSTININIHQILNIFPPPWYRPTGNKLFIIPILQTGREMLDYRRGKLKQRENSKASLFMHCLSISLVTNVQLNKHYVWRTADETQNSLYYFSSTFFFSPHVSAGVSTILNDVTKRHELFQHNDMMLKGCKEFRSKPAWIIDHCQQK